MAVSNIFYFHPYLRKIPILTKIFQMGWNHQLENYTYRPIGGFVLFCIYIFKRVAQAPQI